MVKNEEKRLHVTLNSIIGVASSLVVYDTGSTDRTIEILEEFSKTNKIPLRIKSGEFIDFSTSRNVLLDFVDTFEDIHYILMLDCNDELRGGSTLLAFCRENLFSCTHAWYVTQEWWSGTLQNYINRRLIRPRKGWRFKGVVHEFLENTKEPTIVRDRVPPQCILYQDRTQDDDKTRKRFARDLALLLDEHRKSPTDTRVLFYLAQTYGCLGDRLNAFKYYSLRSQYPHFPEERYESMLKCGRIIKHYVDIDERLIKEIDALAHINSEPAIEKKKCIQSKLDEHRSIGVFTWEDALKWFLNGAQVFGRIEVYIEIAKYYTYRDQHNLAYTFLHTACIQDIPVDSCLFVEKNIYDYERWHLMGRVAYYVKQYDEGERACILAIRSRNQEIDKRNLLFYTNRKTPVHSNMS